MTFTKTELEIVAYCVSLLECDVVTNSPIKKDFNNILAKLQSVGIWGRLENKHFYEEENFEEILLSQIEDITETDDGDFRCSTCDQVNDIVKNR
jgi:hypothetical protein|tara:strand:+ start:116 stop:397 length:282 start_codon:yes stop_codon:yes gene_type:complete